MDTDQDVFIESPRRSGKKWFVIAFLVLVPIGLIVFAYVYFTSKARQELQDAIAEADRLDPNWQLSDIEDRRIQLRNEENSALRVLEVKATLPQTGVVDPDNDLFEDLTPEAQLNEPQIQALRDYVAKAGETLKSARELAEMPHGRFAVKWTPDFISTKTSCQDVREVANALKLDSMLRAQDKDIDEALRSVRAILNAANSIGDEPTSISQLIRVACRAVAVNQLERVLAQGEPSEAALAALQRLFEQEEQPSFLVLARGERAGTDMLLENLEKGRASFGAVAGGTGGGAMWELRVPGMLTSQRAEILRYTTEVVEIAKMPVEKQAEALRALEKSASNKSVLVRLLAPAHAKLHNACLRDQAFVRNAIVALAAERYRKAKGAWPESIETLVKAAYLKQAPLDPYDGKPLRMKARLGGALVYSVGPDGEDNGGKFERRRLLDPGFDLGFELWDVAKRRQPALPPKPKESGDGQRNRGAVGAFGV